MKSDQSHLSDRELLSALDGELARTDQVRAQSHLAACWSCRARQNELNSAIGALVRLQRDDFANQIPSANGPRALLKARMAQVQAAENERSSHLGWLHRARVHWPVLGASFVFASLVCIAVATWSMRPLDQIVPVIKPDPNLTPGATVLVNKSALCGESKTNNKAVSLSLQQRIFEEYGIHTRRVNAYEVDYLITPALGGADDIHNLWPQSKGAGPWNAMVKDALEDHLRDMVCDGQVDLAVAQHDMAADWILAYKKYFHTDHPIAPVP